MKTRWHCLKKIKKRKRIESTYGLALLPISEIIFSKYHHCCWGRRRHSIQNFPKSLMLHSGWYEFNLVNQTRRLGNVINFLSRKWKACWLKYCWLLLHDSDVHDVVQLFPLRDERYSPIFSLWSDSMSYFHQGNVADVKICYFVNQLCILLECGIIIQYMLMVQVGIDHHNFDINHLKCLPLLILGIFKILSTGYLEITRQLLSIIATLYEELLVLCKCTPCPFLTLYLVSFFLHPPHSPATAIFYS